MNIKNNIIQAYASTANKFEKEMEVFYKDFWDDYGKLPKQDITVLTGDFNAKVDKRRIMPY